jgi:uncharacterized protein DUF6339
MSNARILLPGVRPHLGVDFRTGGLKPDVSDFVREMPIDRDLPIDRITRLLAQAQDRHPEEPALSDRWLAPRLHAGLRLRRSEAAEAGFWGWLAVEHAADYVRWRFPGKGDEEEDPEKRGTPLKRFLGRDRDHALGRLWWGAELFRKGADYGPAADAFVMQDVPNTWLSLDAVHNSAAAQAALRLLPQLSGREINALSKAMDHVLTTVQLDALAPVRGPDVIAMDEWVAEEVDEEALFDDTLPGGPAEDPVDSELIEAVDGLLRHVATVQGLELPPAEEVTV